MLSFTLSWDSDTANLIKIVMYGANMNKKFKFVISVHYVPFLFFIMYLFIRRLKLHYNLQDLHTD